MSPAAKVSLALGTLIAALGVIIGVTSRPITPPVPMPDDRKEHVIPDPSAPGKCWKVRSDGYSQPWPCPTPTKIMPWTRKVQVAP